MSLPKVEFFLSNVIDTSTRIVLDRLREWFDYIEDRGFPAIQTFEGELAHGQEVRLEVTEPVYGYSGMTTKGDYWEPMLYSVTAPTERCYFALELDNINGTYVKVRCNSTTGSKKYRASVFFRG